MGVLHIEFKLKCIEKTLKRTECKPEEEKRSEQTMGCKVINRGGTKSTVQYLNVLCGSLGRGREGRKLRRLSRTAVFFMALQGVTVLPAMP